MTNLIERVVKMIPTENKSLFIDVAKGNEKSFEKLFLLYKDSVYSIAFAYTESEQDAEEIVHDVFLRVWKYRQKLFNVENFSAWLHTVTRNKSLTVLKKMALDKKKKEDLIISNLYDKNCDVEQKIEDKELQLLLRNALEHLSPQQRKIFELSRLNGVDRKTIAATLGLSPATVSAHLTIALHNVRTFLLSHMDNTVVCAVLFMICYK